MNPPLLIVPGLGGSGPQHWQSLWELLHMNSYRVQQQDWDNPLLVEWITVLEQEIKKFNSECILVAHSLGCTLISHWSLQTKQKIKAALLVAPPDVWRSEFPPEAQTFSPMPLEPLPFPSIVVASSNDPYCDLKRAHYFAVCWKSHFIDIGKAGHINADSNVGNWPQGLKLLETLF